MQFTIRIPDEKGNQVVQPRVERLRRIAQGYKNMKAEYDMMHEQIFRNVYSPHDQVDYPAVMIKMIMHLEMMKQQAERLKVETDLFDQFLSTLEPDGSMSYTVAI